MERRLLALKELNHLFAIGRVHDVGDERFSAELANTDVAGRGKRMFWGDDKDQFIEEYDNGMQIGLLWLVRENAEFGRIAEDIVGNVAAQRTLDGDLDHGMHAAKLGQDGQKVKNSELVRRNDELSFL